MADIRARLATLPMSVNVGQPISHRLDHLLSGVRAEIALKVYGEDLDTLRTLAETFRDKLSRIDGLVDLQIEKQVRIPQLRVTVNHERIALYGITPSAVTKALEGLSNGRVVSQILQGNRRFDVVLRLKDADRSTQGLTKLLIPTPNGYIPLGLVASVTEVDGPNQNSARERPAPHRCSRQHRRQARHGQDRRQYPECSGCRTPAKRLSHEPRRRVPGPGRGGLADRPLVAHVAGADLRGALYALPVLRSDVDHHG